MSCNIIETQELLCSAYSAPKLTIYGNVTTLTASGSGTTSENGTFPSCSPPNNTKKPC